MLHSGLCVLTVFIVCAFAGPAPFPLADTVLLARSRIAAAPPPIPTGLTKNDYIQSLSGITGYFRTKLQNANGIIIDPYTGPREVQYATPTFAFAAITQGLVTDDDVTLVAGIKALNASLQNLIDNRCADSHCNFFTLPLMLCIETLKPYVSSGLYTFYLSQAQKVKSSSYTNNDINWGVVAAAGDFVRYLLGQTNTAYFENIFSTHLKFFSTNGMYQDATPVTNPSTTYDIFPRLYIEYCLFRGYNGTSAAALTEYMERGALASLLLQSPYGENPTGGRSSQHQWNEAVLIYIFELRANMYKARGDMVMASAFKRGARLAHQSFRRWFSPEGYVWIVKNHFNPALRFGYEIYSHLTQYNGMPASWLALAYTIADDTIPEGPSFAETGGYVLEVPAHRKIVANVKGNYYEWETMADKDYDSTGLTRIHHLGTWPLAGFTAATSISAGALSLGVGWTKGNTTEVLAQFGTSLITQPAYLNISIATPELVEFNITYPVNSSKAGVTQVIETVSLTQNKILIATSLTGNVDSITFRYPIFLFDGIYNTTYNLAGNKAQMQFGVTETYTVENPAGVTLTYQDLQVKSRNGYLGVATATVPATESQYIVSVEHGAESLQTQTFTVGPSGADFTTIGAALNVARSLSGVFNYVIEIQSGTYAEKVVVDTPNGILRASSTPVTITYQTTSAQDASLSITAANVKIYGLTVLSTANIGSALSINPSVASQTSFYECSFYGFGDTIQFRNSFVLAYFNDSYIEGGADMIVGSGTVYFDECILASNGAGSVTAMSGISASNTDEWIFNYATLVATTPSAPIASFANPSFAYTSSSQFAGSNYLGRPADSFSRVYFLFSNLGGHINAHGWTAAGYSFGEFQTVGPSAFGTERIASAALLTGDAAASLSLVGVLGGLPVLLPQWIDQNYLPGCAAIYGMCNNQASFAVPKCCQAGLTCVYQTEELSQCQYIPLSNRTNGWTRVYQSNTFGLAVICVYNPWGPVTVSYNSSTTYAYFDAVLVNAVAESVVDIVTKQMIPVPILNITIDYASWSDPRGAAVGLHITLPSSNPIKVINTTPNQPQPPTPPPVGTPAPASPSSSVPFPPTGLYVNSAPVLSALSGLIAAFVALLL